MSKSPRTVKDPSREWSHFIPTDDIPMTGKKISVSPDTAQKAAIASRIGVVDLKDFKVDFQLMRESGHIIHVQGHLKAKVTQSCVVTLEDIESKVEDEFEAWFTDAENAVPFKKLQHEALSKKEMLDLPMLEESEDPDPVENGKIDLGEVAVQYLSLAVEPYPCKPGVSLPENVKGEDSKVKNELRANPFAALKNWRPKD